MHKYFWPTFNDVRHLKVILFRGHKAYEISKGLWAPCDIDTTERVQGGACRAYHLEWRCARRNNVDDPIVLIVMRTGTNACRCCHSSCPFAVMPLKLISWNCQRQTTKKRQAKNKSMIRRVLVSQHVRKPLQAASLLLERRESGKSGGFIIRMVHANRKLSKEQCIEKCDR